MRRGKRKKVHGTRALTWRRRQVRHEIEAFGIFFVCRWPCRSCHDSSKHLMPHFDHKWKSRPRSGLSACSGKIHGEGNKSIDHSLNGAHFKCEKGKNGILRKRRFRCFHCHQPRPLHIPFALKFYHRSWVNSLNPQAITEKREFTDYLP